MKRAAALLPLISVIVMASACVKKEEPAPTTSTAEPVPDSMQAGVPKLAAGVQAQLDSGNAAYSAREYKRARDHFRKVTELDANVSAGWFGLYMAEARLGNNAAADSAIARARKTEKP